MRILPIFVSVITVLSLTAQTNSITLPVTSATIYERGAIVERTGSLSLGNGVTTVEITDLPLDLDESTLSVLIKKDVIILSQKVTREYTDPNKIIGRYDDAKQEILDSIDIVKSHQSILKGEERILNENINLTSSGKGFTATEVSFLRSNYANEMKIIKSQTLQNKIILRHLSKVLKDIINQIAEEGAKGSKGSAILILELQSGQSKRAPIEISYYHNEAGWISTYDLRVNGLTKPLEIVYKANIYQNTGEDWSDVKLSLSTASPDNNYSLPKLTPYYMNFNPHLAVLDAGHLLEEEVVVTGYSGYNDDQESSFSKKEKKQKYIPYSIVKSQTSLYYDIATLLSLPSSDQRQTVLIRSEPVPVSYRYNAYPKITKNAYLIGQIKNWAELQIVPGLANIYIDNRYIGQTSIGEIQEDTQLYTLSLGQDKEVYVERTLTRGYTRKRFVGNKRIDNRKWTLKSVNNKSEAIKLSIEDQYPISQTSDIKVDLKEASDATINEDTGALKWLLSLNPKEAKELLIEYEIKSPKGRNLIVD